MPALCQYRGNSAQPQEERNRNKPKNQKQPNEEKNAYFAFRLHLGQTLKQVALEHNAIMIQKSICSTLSLLCQENNFFFPIQKLNTQMILFHFFFLLACYLLK